MTKNLSLRFIEPFRSKDGVQAEVYKYSLGGEGCVVIKADTATGEEAEVTLNIVEAHDLMLWLQCALGLDKPSSAVEPKPDAMCKHDDGDCHPEDPCDDCPKLQPRSECPRCGVMILTGPNDQHFCRGQRTKP